MVTCVCLGWGNELEEWVCLEHVVGAHMYTGVHDGVVCVSVFVGGGPICVAECLCVHVYVLV